MRDIALLALLKGVVPTAICFGLEPKDVEQWMHSLGNDPFFAVIRRLIWEHLQKHDVEQTAQEFRMSIMTIQRIRKYMQHQRDLGQPLEEPEAIETNELTGSAIALSGLTYSEASSEVVYKTEDIPIDVPRRKPSRPKPNNPAASKGDNAAAENVDPSSDELEGASDDEKGGESAAFLPTDSFFQEIKSGKKDSLKDRVLAKVTKEAKAKMIEEVRQCGDLQAVAERYHVHVSTLKRWIQDAEKSRAPKTSLIKAYRKPSEELTDAYNELLAEEGNAE